MSSVQRAIYSQGLSRHDVKNLALQRTSSLWATPTRPKVSPSYYFWSKHGSDRLLDLEVRWRREAILRISFEEIEAELARILPHLEGRALASIMDIGCGLGIPDVILARTGRVSKIALVDIDTSDSKHHGFEESGSGYNSLETSRYFITQNIDKDIEVLTVNPQREEMSAKRLGKYDLIFSLISCGFHYPAATYKSEFRELLNEGGVILIDLRLGVDHSDFLDAFSVVDEVCAAKAYRRVIVQPR